MGRRKNRRRWVRIRIRSEEGGGGRKERARRKEEVAGGGGGEGGKVRARNFIKG